MSTAAGPGRASGPSARRVGAATLAAGLVVLVVLAWWRVPWSPVPGGAPAPAPAADWFTPAQVRRGADFASWARVWSLSSAVVSLLVALAWALAPAGRRLAGCLRGPWWARVPVVVAVLVVSGRVVTLPFAVAQRRRVRAFGLSEQDWWGFAADLARGQALTVVATSAGVLALLVVARRWPRAWPAVGGLLLGALVLLGSFVYPVLVEPVSNRFEPLADGPLRTGVLDLAERGGTPLDDVLVADASRRTTTLNAYVSGWGSTRRVVLYDTLVRDLPEDEVLSVVAHELTHARHDDVLTGSVLGASAAVAGVGLLGVLLRPRRDGTRDQRAPWDAGDVARVLALLAVLTTLTTPVQGALSRRIELRADVGALASTGDPASFIELQQQLAVRSAADLEPPAAWQWWFGSHPTTLQRIALALRAEG